MDYREGSRDKRVPLDLEMMSMLAEMMTQSQEVGEWKEEELAVAAATDLREGRRCEVKRGRRWRLLLGSCS